MRNRMRRLFACMLAAAFLLTGCGTARTPEVAGEKKKTVRISMYNDISYSGWRTYVEKQFPDIQFIWENNRNSTQGLLYRARHGDLADLVMIRRFESDSAADLAPYLLDLSKEELTSTFTEGSLVPFTFNHRVRWYPAPGMIECIFANVSLFDRCHIKIPETVTEFENACRRFEDLGIDGFTTDLSSGFRAAFFLEGFEYSELASGEEGKTWLRSFLQGKNEPLPENSCEQLAARLRAFKESGVLHPADFTVTEADSVSAFDAERAAMIMGGSDYVFHGKSGTEICVIPCLGETAKDRILYTYPVFSTAVSKKAAADAGRRELLNRILKAMYSSEAQQALAEGTEALVSYNTDITLPIGGPFSSVSDLISGNRKFIRYLNRNTFAASVQGIKEILENQADNAEFSERLNAQLVKPADTGKAGHSSIYAGNRLGELHPLERPAASVLAQTVRKSTGADAVILEGKDAAAPLYEGDYTENDLRAAVTDEPLYEAGLTWKQLEEVLDSTMLATTTYRYHALEPMVDYPALGGIRAALSADGITNTVSLPDGSRAASGTICKTVVSAVVYRALTELRSDLAALFRKTGQTTRGAFREQLSAGTLPKPERYFDVEVRK